MAKKYNVLGEVVPGDDAFNKFIFANDVDKFLKEFGILYKIRATGALGPTAYMIKE